MLRKRAVAVAMTALVGCGGALAWGGVAAADTGGATYQVANTGGANLNVHSGPQLGAPVTGQLAAGQSVTISCQTTGDEVNGTSDIWDQLSTGGYVSDYYMDTPVVGAPSPGIPNCSMVPPPSSPQPPGPPPPPAYSTSPSTPTSVIADNSGNGICSTEETWVDSDGHGDIRVNVTNDGGTVNSAYAEIDTSPGGSRLAVAGSGDNFGISAHSFAQTNWVYVGVGTSVYVWSLELATIPSTSPQGFCNDVTGSGYWVTA